MEKTDDRKTYEQLMEEAMTQIPMYTEEWTNFQPSEPAMAIMESLCGFSILQQNEICGLPEKLEEKLLNLAGFFRKRTKSSRILVKAENVKKSLLLPVNQKFQVGDLVFESENSLEIPDGRLVGIYVKNKQGVLTDMSKLIENKLSVETNFFGEKPKSGTEIYFVFNRLPSLEKEIILYFRTGENKFRNSRGADVRFADITWQCLCSGGYEDICVCDETNEFVFEGAITFKVEEKAMKYQQELPENGYVIRGIIRQADYDISPSMVSVWAYLFPLRQKSTKSAVYFFDEMDMEDGGLSCYIYSDLLEEDYVRVYVRENGMNMYRVCKEDEFDRCRQSYGQYQYRFRKKYKSAAICAYSKEIMEQYRLGVIYGYDGEKIKLPVKNINEESFILIGETKNRHGQLRYEFVLPGKKSGRGLLYELSGGDGEIEIVETGKYAGCNLYMGMAAVSRGQEGNIPSGKELVPWEYDTDVRFTNISPGTEGCSEETSGELKKRFLRDVYQPFTAVTDEDYERIVKNIASLAISKVKAVADREKNQVKIAVMPYGFQIGDRLAENYKKAILSELETRRLLTTRIVLENPVFAPVDVRGAIYVKEYYRNCMEIIEDRLRAELDYVSGGKNLGEILRFDQVFAAVEDLECIDFIEDLSIKPRHTLYAKLQGADVKPENNCLLYPGIIKITLNVR